MNKYEKIRFRKVIEISKQEYKHRTEKYYIKAGIHYIILLSVTLLILKLF